MGEIGAVTIRSCSETSPRDGGAAMRTVTSLTRCPIDVASRREPRVGDATTGNYRVVLLYVLLTTWVVCIISTYNRASDVARMYVSHVLDRKLLERLMSPSPKSQVMFAPAFS